MSRLKKWILGGLAIIVILAVGAWIAVLVISVTPAQIKAKADAEIIANSKLTGGAKVFAAKCAYCHMSNGSGAGPSLAGHNLSPEAVGLMVRHGQNVMPAFTPGFLSDPDLSAVSVYVAKISVPEKKS